MPAGFCAKLKINIEAGIILKKTISFFCGILLAAAMIFTGCGSGGNQTALEQYRDKMNTFFDNLATCRDEYESIDPSSDGAPKQLLAVIDEMTGYISDAASVSAPDEFVNVEECAKDAAQYMQRAQTLFHQALDDSENFDPDTFKQAQEFYETANQRVGYMVSFLHGETPEGVTITYEETPDAASASADTAAGVSSSADAASSAGAAETGVTGSADPAAASASGSAAASSAAE